MDDRKRGSVNNELHSLLEEAATAIEADRRAYNAPRRLDLARRLRRRSIELDGTGAASSTLPAVAAELLRARSQHAPIVSAHEALAVIREEYLEVEREVFARTIDRAALRKELLQLAAMCVRTVEDLNLSEEEQSS